MTEAGGENINLDVYVAPSEGNYDNSVYYGTLGANSTIENGNRVEAGKERTKKEYGNFYLVVIALNSVTLILICGLVAWMAYHITNSDADSSDEQVRVLQDEIGILTKRNDDMGVKLEKLSEDIANMSQQIKNENDCLLEDHGLGFLKEKILDIESNLESLKMSVGENFTTLNEANFLVKNSLLSQSDLLLDVQKSNEVILSAVMVDMPTELANISHQLQKMNDSIWRHCFQSEKFEDLENDLGTISTQLLDISHQVLNDSCSIDDLREDLSSNFTSLIHQINGMNNALLDVSELQESMQNTINVPFSEWTIVQRRTLFDLDFERSFAEYENGFYSLYPNGDLWIGLETLHRLTSIPGLTWVMRTDFESWEDDELYWIEYTGFYVGDSSTNYRLTVGTQTGGSFTDDFNYGWRYQDGMQFTAYDADNDWHSRNCAVDEKGGWWYKNCFRVNLNNLQATSQVYAGDHMRYWTPSIGAGWNGLKNSLIRIRPV